MKFKIPTWLNKKNILRLLINRYFLIGLGFLLLLLLGENSLVYYYKLHKQLKELRTSKEFYLNQIKQDSINTIRLRTDMDAIEKYGREKYMMKRDNEDIYIIR
jgi:cell division protein FtsB